MRRLAAPLVVLLLAGCAAPVAELTLDGGDAFERPAPPPPNPKVGPQPVLRADSAFAETPWGFVRKDWTPPATPMPTILMMDGYVGAGEPTHYFRARDGVYVAVRVGVGLATREPAVFGDYVVAYASLRGTGCSGGRFDLFDRTGAYDGHDLVAWLAGQEWSTGRVGLYGESYSAITAFLVAGTAPPSLHAVALSGLVADLYRDIAYPGGVPNVGFPPLWAGAVRPSSDLRGTAEGAEARDEVCAFDVAARGAPDATEQPLVRLAQPEDGAWYQVRSPATYAEDVRAPTLVVQTWQDEQTGPRGGPELFRALDVPKRFVGTNGWHYTAHATNRAHAEAWFAHWLRGLPLDDAPPVEIALASVVTLAPFGVESSSALALDGFPPANVSWTRFHLRAGGALSTEPPPRGETADTFLAGPPRQAFLFDGYPFGTPVAQPGVELRTAEGPDVLAYRTEPFDAPVVVAGPVAATLGVSATATDADLFVVVADVAPDGAMTFLQRGLLRASHRALDPSRTVYDAAGDVVRPWHPHTSPAPLAPGEEVEVAVEVFPFAHVFYPGHRLQVQVTTPPVADGLWSYSAARTPSQVTVFHDADRASRVLVPVVPWEGTLPADPGCDVPDGYRCVR